MESAETPQAGKFFEICGDPTRKVGLSSAFEDVLPHKGFIIYPILGSELGCTDFCTAPTKSRYSCGCALPSRKTNSKQCALERIQAF